MKMISEPYLYDLIFQHLSGQDVKNVFELSEAWSQAANTSKVAMSTIELNIDDSKLSLMLPTDVGLLQDTDRRYQSVRFSIKYKYNLAEKVRIIENISRSLRELHFDAADWLDVKFSPDLSFPNLKRMNVRNGNVPAVKQVLSASLKYLENLSINGSIDIFREPILPDTKVKLTSLTLSPSMSSLVMRGQNFQAFLLSTSSTLRYLSLDSCDGITLELILTKLPVLQNLRILKFYDPDFKQLSNNVKNQSVDSLIWNNFYTNFSLSILKSLENLENLEVFYCQKDLLYRCLKESRKVKTITIWYWIGQQLPFECYEDFKRDDPTIRCDVSIFY